MALFEYKAVAPNGETVRGTMEAADVKAVIGRLQEAGNLPLTAREAGGGFGLERWFGAGRGIGAREIGEFTRHLATLLGAGLPLDRALHVLVELAETPRLRRMIDQVRDQVREGGSLSGALEAQHGVFSRLFVNMVRAGEAGGSLEQTLDRLADYLERSKELKDHVLTALFYPLLLFIVAGAAVVILLVYVIPQFTPIFEEMGAELPLLTRLVLGVAEFVRDRWWLLFGLAALAVWWWRGARADPARRLQWDTRFLRTRWLGDLLAKLDAARFTRTAGTLLENGVPLLGALSIARNVLANSHFQGLIEAAAKEVKGGAGLARTLAKDEYFPRLALQMIGVGEETGQLDRMLIRVADTFDREVRTTVERLLALFTPVLILTMALVIGTIVMSVVMAMLGMNDLVA